MSILFEHVTAVTMDPAAPVLHDAFVLVEGTAISQVGQTRPQGEFDRVVDCTGKVMMPGLINAHTHLPMTLMRGYGGGTICSTGSTTISSPPRTSWTAPASGRAPCWPWPSLSPGA